jgi:transcriptional regulator GlxA family with amidase domain
MATYEPDLPELERVARACGYHQGAMAKRMGISRRHLDRRFKQRFGRPLREWLAELRVSDFERFLLASHPRLKDALEAASFRHSSSLSRWYKAHKGVPPSSVGPHLPGGAPPGAAPAP